MAVWIAFAGFALAFVVQTGAFAYWAGREVQKNESHREKVSERLSDISKRFEKIEFVDEREESKVLKEIEKLETEMRDGITYLGGCLANLAITLNDHETRIHAIEKSSGVSRPRMPAMREPPRPPGWMPPAAHVPAIKAEESGGFRAFDPLKDPRREPAR